MKSNFVSGMEGKGKEDRRDVLLLGSKGFIGKGIVENLSKDHSFAIKGLSSTELNLSDFQQVKSIMPDMMRDSTVIMAAAITPDKDNSLTAMLSNIQMVSNVAQIVSSPKVRHFVYISTVDVYGRKNLILPLSEESRIQPSDYYAISKLTGEFIVKRACGEAQIPSTILRLPGVYGPGDTHNSPIKSFVTSAIRKKKIRVTGDGSQLRDFLFIGDLCGIIKSVISRKVTGVYNIVTGKSSKIIQILGFLEKISNFPLDVVYVSGSNNTDLVFEKPRILEILSEFDFTDIETGLKNTYAYYRRLQI